MIELLSGGFSTELGLAAICSRMAAAAGFGLVIGFDREVRSVSAGLRTHMLVSLAAATFAILAFEIVAQATREGIDNADPVRIIEAVTAGVAFLAAGTIIRGGDRVRGLTTGAGLWLAGAIGLACGVGAWAVAFIATLLGIVILTVLRHVERILALKPRTASRDAGNGR